MIENLIKRIFWWFMCKINRPVYSASLFPVFGKLCLSCRKVHKKTEINFFKALLIFVQMYKYGFFFSDNTHEYYDRSGRWGFYRFNHVHQPAIFDIDFSIGPSEVSYYHVHGDDCRLEFQANGEIVKEVRKQPSSFRITKGK